ncbi:hypothetical protein [Geosporobacter ferrireducens]|uniref:hypothetical protein n=1 Tax=Geosporobacter ferrireducens TaxID=1424294 RepID=UPI0023523C46|nr:hypothetical protein [Geosporobacter ferrireducens]
MNNTQRTLFAIYIPITLLIVIFDNIYSNEAMVQHLKYTIMITLCFSVTVVRKKFWEQKLMALSFLFMVIADFFLVFSTTVNGIKADFSLFGIAGFLFAYLSLIAAYHKNFKVGKAEAITVIPVASIFLYVFVSLRPYVKGFMFIETLIFGVVLCYMTWTAVCTIFRGYFNPRIASLIALSGSLMFICDMGVAFSLFHPLYAGSYMSWPKSIVWAAYILGWTILAVIVSEKDLRISTAADSFQSTVYTDEPLENN